MARISYLAALTFAKLSIVAFIRHISPVTLHRGMTTGLAAFIGLVWIAETITVALQCSPPQPWDFIHSKCLNLVRLPRFERCSANLLVEEVLVLCWGNEYLYRPLSRFPSLLGYERLADATQEEIRSARVLRCSLGVSRQCSGFL